MSNDVLLTRQHKAIIVVTIIIRKLQRLRRLQRLPASQSSGSQRGSGMCAELDEQSIECLHTVRDTATS